jgi:demethylmenaquinone methyltransferase / 2-methoxy-6-polyprenyl-1,4-benzoquinol methylase
VLPIEGRAMLVHRSRTEPNRFARSLFAGLPPRYDRLAAALSLGQDRRWRRAMIDHLTGTPRLVLDVATGPAGVAVQIADRTGAAVVGIDLSEPMLRRGRARVVEAGREHKIVLALGRAEELPFPDGCFDALAFTYLLRYVADPAATLAELARVVRPGGSLVSLEFAVPRSRVWRTAWLLYTRGVLPVAGAILGGRAWYDVGRFLGPSVTEHDRRHPVGWMVEAWQKAGIDDVGVRHMSLGGGLVMWGRRAP